MAFSYQNYTGDNATTQFSIPFTYQNTAEISVTVNGVAETGLTFPSSSTVLLTSAPATGTLVQVRRTTSLTARAIDFASGSVLTEEDLDDSNIQVFHASQESVDRAEDSIQLGTDNKWDALGSVIKNVGTPTATTDAATKAYADGISAAAVVQATAAASAQVTAATGSIIPDATKLAIHPIGSQYTLSDGVTIDYSAKHYQDAAATSATNAGTSETNAATSKTNAQEWAIKTTGIVDATGYSAKAWSIGGTNVTNTAGAGASQEWATKTTTSVDGTEFSAKEYAIGSQAANPSGSAKQWSLGGGVSYDANTTVDGVNYSARYWAEQAAAAVDNFDDTYLGPKSSAPTVDNDGDPLNAGDLYFDTTASQLYVYDGAAWQATVIAAGSTATAGFAIAMAVAL
jgi:hypothetical protein